MEYIEKVFELERLKFMMSEFARENNLTLWTRMQHDSPSKNEFIFIDRSNRNTIGVWVVIIELDEWNCDVIGSYLQITKNVLENEPIRLTRDNLCDGYIAWQRSKYGRS